MTKFWPKVFVSIAALAALVFAILRGIEVQAGVVALVALAILPRLAAVVESIELPGGGSLRLREIQDKVQRQDKQLHAQQEVISQLVIYSVSWYLFKMLAAFYHRNRSGGEYLFRDDERMRRDLRFLRDHGYLEHFTIADLRDGEISSGRSN